jgi:hypothetical protein
MIINAKGSRSTIALMAVSQDIIKEQTKRCSIEVVCLQSLFKKNITAIVENRGISITKPLEGAMSPAITLAVMNVPISSRFVPDDTLSLNSFLNSIRIVPDCF